MTYAYEHVRGLFELSSWDEDVSDLFWCASVAGGAGESELGAPEEQWPGRR